MESVAKIYGEVKTAKKNKCRLSRENDFADGLSGKFRRIGLAMVFIFAAALGLSLRPRG